MSVKKKPKSNSKPAPIVKPAPKRKSDTQQAPSFFDQPGKKAFYFFIAVLTIVAVIVFRNFLLFHKIFMYKDIGSDTLNTFYPNFIESANYLKKFGTLSWSFNIGMGQDGTTFIYNDPISLLIYLFPVDKIAYLLGYKVAATMVAGGIVFYAYLRTMGKSLFASMAGGLMFAFSGYMVVGGEWYVFSVEALNTALVLLAFELLFRRNILWPFPIAYFLMAIYSPFILFLVTVFLIVYTVFRYIQEGEKPIKDLIILLLKMAGLGAIGVLVSTPYLVDAVKVLQESARASGPDSYFATLSSTPVFGLVSPLELGTCIERFFSSDILGTADAYKGLDNYLEGPLFYCSIPCLLLVPILFGYLDKRQKTLFGIVLAIWLLPVIFPYFRKAFWLFSGDYYRTYSLYVALIFIIFSVTCLDKLVQQKRLNIILLASVTLSLILIQLFPYFGNIKAVNESIATGAKLYILAYAVVLFWMSRQQSDIPKFAFLFILVTELAWFSSVSVNRNSSITANEWKDKIGYNDYSNEAISFIKGNDNSFYRIDKSFGSSPAEHRSLNDAMVQDYYSTSNYYSFNQKYYLQYMRANKVISASNESESRWCPGLINRPILQSLNSDKYVLSKETMYLANDPIHDSIAKFGDVIVYRNKFQLPLGYCYDTYIKYSDFEKFSLTQRDFTSCHSAVVNDADTGLVRNVKQMHLRDSLMPSSFNVEMLKQYFKALRQDTLTITSFNPAHIKGNIDLKASKIMYLSIPYDLGWHLNVDGKPQSILLLSNGMTGVILGNGRHEIQLDYEPVYRTEGGLAAIGGLLLFAGVLFGSYRMRKRTSEKRSNG